MTYTPWKDWDTKARDLRNFIKNQLASGVPEVKTGTLDIEKAGARAYLSSTQTISTIGNGGDRIPISDDETSNYAFDDWGGVIDTANDKLIVPEDGLYDLRAISQITNAPADAQLYLLTYQNGVSISENAFHTSQGNDLSLISMDVVTLSEGDEITFKVGGTPSSVDVKGSSDSRVTNFSLARLA